MSESSPGTESFHNANKMIQKSGIHKSQAVKILPIKPWTWKLLNVSFVDSWSEENWTIDENELRS